MNNDNEPKGQTLRQARLEMIKDLVELHFNPANEDCFEDTIELLKAVYTVERNKK